MRTPLAWVGLLGLLGTGASSGAKPEADIETLPDGLELVVVAPRDATVASMRLVVRTGAAADPTGKAGLAHVVEHLAFHGTNPADEYALWNDVRSRGGTLNAFTTSDWTVYALDAPLPVFETLARNMLRRVTSPPLPAAAWQTERGVVDSEASRWDSADLWWALDQQMFRDMDRGPSIIGSKASRAQIERTDAAQFYSQHYTPANATLLVVAPGGVAAWRSLATDAMGWPPDPETPIQKPSPPKASLPQLVEIRAPVTLTLQAYALPGVSAGACASLAALLQLRLMDRLVLGVPQATSATGYCRRLRGTWFLAATVFSVALGDAFEQVMRTEFAALAHGKPSRKEANIIQRRFELASMRAAADAPSLADALVPSAAYRTSEAPFDLSSVTRPPHVDASAQRTLARAIAAKSYVQLRAAPWF